jgi:hypothetical protein
VHGNEIGPESREPLDGILYGIGDVVQFGVEEDLAVRIEGRDYVNSTLSKQ